MAAPPPPLSDDPDVGEAPKAPASATAVPPTPTSPGGSKIMQFASLYVGDLAPDVGEAMLYEAFQEAGTVASCRVCRDSVTRKSLGYGYVNYYSVADAERALDTLNYMSIKGKPCRVMWSQRDPTARRNLKSNVFVKQLSPSVDNKALHDTFSVFGNILSCKVSTDSKGKSRGYGFVHYEAEDSARQAIEKVNGMKIGDQAVFVGPFIKREEGEKVAEAYTNLYVKHLPPAWDQAKLESVFGEFGEVASIWISATDDGKRFALVNFVGADSAKLAVEALHRRDMTSEGLAPEVAKSIKQTASQQATPGEAEASQSAEDCAAAAPAEKADPEDDAAAAPAEKADEEDCAAAAPAEKADPDVPLHCLYVQRAQTRAERKVQLAKDRMERKGSGKGKARPGVKLHIKNLSESTTETSLRELFKPFGEPLHVIVRETEEGKCKGFAFVVLNTMEEAAEATKELHLKVVDGKPLNVGMAEKRRRDLRGASSGEALAEGIAAGDAHAAEGRGKGGRGRSSREGGAKGKGGREGGGDGRDGKGKGKGKDIPPLPYGGAPPVPLSPYGLPPHLRAPVPGAAYPPMGSPCAGYQMPGVPPGQHLPYAPRPAAPYPGGPYALPRTVAGAVPSAAPHFGTAPPAMYPHLPQAGPPPLTREVLSQLHPQQQKQLLGERLYGLIHRHRPDLAGKLTGMILELNNSEILGLIDSESRLQQKVQQAVAVLEK